MLDCNSYIKRHLLARGAKMDRDKVFQLCLKFLGERRRQAEYNAKHMNVDWYKKQLEQEAKDYADAEKIFAEEMTKNDN